MASAAGSKGAFALNYNNTQRMKYLRRKYSHNLNTSPDKSSSNEMVYKDENFMTGQENNCLEKNR